MKEATDATRRSGFNYPYHAEVGHTEIGSPVIRIVAHNRNAPSGHYRRMNAFVYELASEMEKRSEELGAKWAISPNASDARITLELANGNETERRRADAFVVKLLVEWNLA
jgi:antitoxin (DNA-binding transcriptional repressor) of toxin-antitoxin stability system